LTGNTLGGVLGLLFVVARASSLWLAGLTTNALAPHPIEMYTTRQFHNERTTGIRKNDHLTRK
jgi:hypothetical protein